MRRTNPTLTRSAPPIDSGALLRAYVDGSNDAFHQLIDCFVDLVYAAALRHVREPAMADDVTQAVFILLSRKARKLRRHMQLGGWLLRVTRFASRDALKLAARRRRYEKAAAALRPQMVPPVETEPPVSPLDEALARLNEPDRAILVLRYLEGHSPPEVAAALQIAEPAARQRCSRALRHPSQRTATR